MDSQTEAGSLGEDLVVATNVPLPTSRRSSLKGPSSRAMSPVERPLRYSRAAGSVPSLDNQFQEVHGSFEPYDAQVSAASSPYRDLYAPPNSPWLVEGTPPAPPRRSESSTFASENLEKPRFTEGPCKLAVVNDGDKDCFAVLLTRAMITQLKNVCSIVEQVENLEKDYEISTARAYQEEIRVQRLMESTDGTEGAIVHIQKRRELEGAQLEFDRLSNERDLFGQYLNDKKQKLFACQETIINSMRTTLTEGGLLHDDEGAEKAKKGDDPEKEKASSDSEKDEVDVHSHHQPRVDRQTNSLGTRSIMLNVDDYSEDDDDSQRKTGEYYLQQFLAGAPDSWDVSMSVPLGEPPIVPLGGAPPVPLAAPPPVQSDDCFPSQELLHRRAIYDKCIDSEFRRNRLQNELDNGWWIYHRKLIDFQKAVEEGKCSITRSEFDRRDLLYKRELTRKILEIEDEQNKALSEKMALSLAEYDIEQDMAVKEGVLETFGTGTWRVGIEAWLNGVTGGKEQEAANDSVDDIMWKARTVAFAESHSCLDMEAVCVRKVKQYREHCEKLREDVLLQKMSSEGGVPVPGDASK